MKGKSCSLEQEQYQMVPSLTLRTLWKRTLPHLPTFIRTLSKTLELASRYLQEVHCSFRLSLFPQLFQVKKESMLHVAELFNIQMLDHLSRGTGPLAVAVAVSLALA
jgi:hypothetical protein